MTEPSLQPSQEPLSEMLKRLRVARGLSRRDLAGLTGDHGVAWPTIRDLEHGIRLPRPRSLHALADALGLRGDERAKFIAAGQARKAPGALERRRTPGEAIDEDGTPPSVPPAGTGEPRADGEHSAGLPFIHAIPPRTLPYDVETFTGRTIELEKLTAGAQRVVESGRTVVYVIEGMGGLGKTALAVHAAHRIIGQFPDLFPDAHLFLDLRGYTPGVSALTANEALRSLLRDLSVPHELIPAKQLPRTALYRSALANKRALIILDNAKDAAQVQPLLPGSTPSMVIVTSRAALGSLYGATAMRLETPPEAEAIAFFRKVAGPEHVGPDDASLPANPELAEIVRLCGYLPLAVQIVAARLSRRPALALTNILGELRMEHDRLSRFQDRERGVRAAFQSSLRYLDPAERLLFARLGRIPGTDFDVHAAASLAAMRIGQAHDRLESLLDQHLIIQRSPSRYELHDLARLYAREQADPDAALALDRLLNFYLYTAQAADRLFERGLPPTGGPVGGAVKPAVMPELRNSRDARAWLSRELRNLHAAAGFAAVNGRPRVALGLSAALSDYLRTHGPWPWALSLHRSAHQVATDIGDQHGQAGALRGIGGVQSRTGEIIQSKEMLGEALGIYRALKDRPGTGRTLIELGIAQRVAGETTESLTSLTEALGIYERLGNRLGQAAAHNEIGSVLWQTGPLSEAGRHVADALRIFQEEGNEHGQAAALLYLAAVQQSMQELRAAEESLREAETIGRQLGQPILVANSLLYLGDVQREARSLTAARESLEEAQSVYRQISHRQGIATALTYLGRTLLLLGEYREADARMADALILFDQLGDPSGKAEALNDRAAVAHALGESATSRGYHEEALKLAIVAKSAREQGAAHLGLALIDADTGSRAEAISHCRSALALYEQMEDAKGAAKARSILKDLGEASRAPG